MANNRLVAALKEAQKRADIQEQFRRLSESPATTQTDRFDSVPVIGQASLNVEPEYSLADRFSNFSAGLGRSLGEGAVGTLNMVAHPVETARALYGAARSAVADPKATASQLADALQRDYRAMTSGDMYETGQTLGKYLSLRPKPRNVAVSELDVYHGTPHRFPATEANPLGEFDASKIGTGEGAQAYGHGIYLAERENVARDYAHSLSQRLPDRLKLDSTPVKGDDFFSRSLEDMALLGKQAALQKLDDNIRFNQNYAPEMAALYRSTREQIEKIDPASVSLNRGNLLKADLPDEMIDRMLDWDKPLSEQPAAVREALKRRITDVQPTDKFDMGGNSLLRDNRLGQYDKTRINPWILVSSHAHGTSAFGLSQKDVDRMFGKKDVANLTGEQIISRLAQQQGGQSAASAYLRSIGIPGIKYLDAGSRGQGGSGTRNFVVFPGEEKKVKILERK